MKKIKALQNFGHAGENIAKGTILDVTPEEFGGTYEDFKTGGFFEEIPEAEAAPADPPKAKAPTKPKAKA